jgi:hypothetical protein
MIRALRLAVAMTAVLTAVGDARAQYGYGYPRGYGAYGWGGWGSTPQGSLARGLGAFSMGRGIYNENTAVARSINTNTVMRWNNYVYQSTQAAANRYAARMRAERARTTRLRGEIQDRLRNHPEQRDITDGDALNTLLDVVLNPAVVGSSLQLIKTPLRHDVIRDIPFEYASEGMTVCLDRMTMEDQWPLALRVEAFRPTRETVRKAVAAALEEDKEGNLEPETIRAVQTAIDQLRQTFDKLVPQSSPDYIPAHDTIQAMSGLTRMLYSPQMEQIIAELEDYQGTTLGDLLGFMQAFNLRFAPANSFRQRQIYLKLYPMLAEQANGSLGSRAGNVPAVATEAVNTVEKTGGEAVRAAEGAGSRTVDVVEDAGHKAANGLKSAAIEFFKDMRL